MIKFNEMEVNKDYKTFAVIEQVSVANTKNGKKYLDLKLYDGVISMSAKAWNHSGDAPTLGSVIVTALTMGEYNDAKQITVNKWRPITEEDGVSSVDFVRRSMYSKEELDAKFTTLMNGIEDNDYRLIVEVIYKEFKEDFLNAPAALKHHQNYIGGLAEHSIGVAKKADALADDTTDKSLLCAGALIHDIGKIFTYDWSGMNLAMTDSGKLLDHIVMGIQVMQHISTRLTVCKPNKPDTFKHKLLLLNHIIASHHGKQEWGSPVTPRLKEAFIVHQADVADASMATINFVLDNTDSSKSWTDYHRDLNGEILKNLTVPASDLLMYGGYDNE